MTKKKRERLKAISAIRGRYWFVVVDEDGKFGHGVSRRHPLLVADDHDVVLVNWKSLTEDEYRVAKSLRSPLASDSMPFHWTEPR